MKYRLTHTTKHSYDEVVPFCQNVAFLKPRRLPQRQSCSFFRLQVQPAPASRGQRTDFFGNTANYFTVTESHQEFEVTATSLVEVMDRPPFDPEGGPGWEEVRDGLPQDLSPAGLEAYQFCFPSPHVPCDAGLADFARPSFPAGRPLLAGAADLTGRIFEEFTYDPQATTVNTPVAEVLRSRRGVCQDLAHLQLGALRSLGLAARYVSGYLRTIPPPGTARLTGADASHAWLSVYAGELGWIDLDPTNNLIPGEDHITVAWGRDYGDVRPIGGLFVGGGSHALDVSVDVAPLEDSDTGSEANE